MANNLGYSDNDIDALLKGIFSGRVNPYSLPKRLYLDTANKLLEGLKKGAGEKNIVNKKTVNPNVEMLSEMRENIYIFSAAKTFQQVYSIGQSATDENGIPRKYSEFKNDASRIFDDYNGAWLESEYNTALAMADSAVKWNRIEAQKQTLPNLRYSAVMDDSTSEQCAALNGTVAPVNDEIWDEFTPPNHFNCRCMLLQESSDVATTDNEDDISIAEEKTPDIFKMNPAKDKVVFKDNHPYFTVPKQYENLAQKNFNLPIPEND